MSNELDARWAPADKAFQKGQQAYIEFGKALAAINATQEEVAARYDMSSSGVSQLLAIVKDERILKLKQNERPKAMRSLYELTTLDDEGFAEMAKPDVTSNAILEYKRAKKTPPPAGTTDATIVGEKTEVVQTASGPISRPACPGVEGTKPGEYTWHQLPQLWVMNVKKETHPEVPKPEGMTVAEAEAILCINPMPKHILELLYQNCADPKAREAADLLYKEYY